MTGYYTDEEEFLKRVEKDATEFKPLGEKIFSYKRKVGPSKGKKKAFDSGDDLDENSDDVVVYEVYHVSICVYSSQFVSHPLPRLLGIPRASENIID